MHRSSLLRTLRITILVASGVPIVLLDACRLQRDAGDHGRATSDTVLVRMNGAVSTSTRDRTPITVGISMTVVAPTMRASNASHIGADVLRSIQQAIPSGFQHPADVAHASSGTLRGLADAATLSVSDPRYHIRRVDIPWVAERAVVLSRDLCASNGQAFVAVDSTHSRYLCMPSAVSDNGARFESSR